MRWRLPKRWSRRSGTHSATAPSPQPLSRRERGFKSKAMTIRSTGYQSGFGNEFASEAVPGSLPAGRNSPQQVAHGLYAEQLSGTAFTAPRSENRRSWLYRIRPAAIHGEFVAMGEVGFHNRFDEQPATPNQLRWSPPPIPAAGTDWLDGLFTMAGNGGPGQHTGIGIHVYAA